MEQEGKDKEVLTISEAAKQYNVTRQAIYVAIKMKKLRAAKRSSQWTIHVKDLEEYRQNRYSRTKSRFDGELIFDKEKGYFSVNETARFLGVPAQKIYYATRVGKLKAHRKGAAWVMHIDDIMGYKRNLEAAKAAEEEEKKKAV